MTRDARPIRARALDTDTFNRPEAGHPAGEHLVPVGGRAERLDPQQTAVHVDNSSDVHITMCVDPTHDQAR
jgi:hypothetical protein